MIDYTCIVLYCIFV